MVVTMPDVFRRPLLAGALASAALLAWMPPAEARVTKLVVDTKTSPAFAGASFGNSGQYETIAAADNAMAQGYLLKVDRDALIAAATASSVLQ